MTKPIDKATKSVFIPLPKFPPRHAANLDWMEQARCTNMNPDDFFPSNPNGGSQHAAAKHIIETACDYCPVADQCEQYARDIRATHGVWGGRDFGAHRRDRDDDY